MQKMKKVAELFGKSKMFNVYLQSISETELRDI